MGERLENFLILILVVAMFILGFMCGNTHYLRIQELELINVSANGNTIECRVIDYPNAPKVQFRR